MSQGLLIGGLAQVRPPYGTTQLPVSSGASLSGVTVGGGFFRLADLGAYILEVSLRIAANNADTPCTLQLFNVTSGLVEASQSLLAVPTGVGADYTINLPFTVTSATDDYVLRIVVTYASDSAGVTILAPNFTAVVFFPAGSGGGGGALTFLTTSQKTIVFADSPYTVLAADATLFADATGGPITVNLPAAAANAGRIITVKKIDSSANEVTIDPNGAETLDGAVTQSIGVQYTSYSMQSDGANWFIAP